MKLTAHIYYYWVSSCFIIWLIIFPFSIGTAQSEMKILVNPDVAIGVPTSRIFNEVRFIPLETTKESLFGGISRMVVTHDYFIILDQDRYSNSILFFDKKGKFIHKIRGEDVNKNLSNQIFSFNYSPAGTIVALNHKGEYEYDLNGNLIKKLPLESLSKTSKRIGAAFAYFRTGEKVELNLFPSIKDSVDYELVITNEKSGSEKKLFPFNGSTGNPFARGYITPPFYETMNDSTLLFTRPYDYIIYSLSPQSAAAKYHFIFPENISLPPGFREEYANNKKIDSFSAQKPEAIIQLNNVWEFGSLLFFSLEPANLMKEKKASYLLDKKTGILYDMRHIIPDSLSSFIPVNDAGIGVNFLNQSFVRHGSYLYASFSSLTLFNLRESQIQNNKKINPPARLKDYYEKENRKSNPVLVELKPKEEL